MSDLGPLSEIVCVRGESFAISGPNGDIVPGGDHGVYVRDTRFLNHLEVEVAGQRPVHLSGASIGGHRAVFHAYLPPSPDQAVDPTLAVTRKRVVDGGLREEVGVSNAGPTTVTVAVTIRVGADFAYIFDVKHGLVLDQMPPEPDGETIAFHRAGGEERTVVTAEGAVASDDRLTTELTVPPGGTAAMVVEVAATDHHGETGPHPGAESDALAPAIDVAGRSDPDGVQVRCSDERFARLLRRSLTDLRSLTLEDPESPGDHFAAAGSPWFLTLFGRDAIWAALMALPYDLELARGTLRALARRQGTRVDHDIEEEPGKILHEVRRGSLAHRGDLPPFYYGSVDATPLFVMLAHEAWCWGLPEDELRALLPNIEAALAWLRDFGDPDDDGFVEYVRHGDRGLANQGWKDSFDGIRFADGSIARAPLALCEVQGYAYEAAVRGAELFDRLGRPGAEHWRQWAAALRNRFRDRFWVDDAGGSYPAIALDQDGRQVDSIASNMGHLLATGLLDPPEVALVANRLAAPDMVSGWGLRTLSAASRGYNPLSYHCGSVWPHDTAIAAWGLARTGHAQPAMELVGGLVRAAPTFNFRLPELFAGFSPERSPLPVPYPASCRPQAWAAGGALLLSRAVIGLDARLPDGHVTLRPVVPFPLDRLEIDGLPLAAGHVNLRLRDGAATVEVHDTDVKVAVEPW